MYPIKKGDEDWNYIKTKDGDEGWINIDRCADCYENPKFIKKH